MRDGTSRCWSAYISAILVLAVCGSHSRAMAETPPARSLFNPAQPLPPLTTCRVTGSPDPAPPYSARRRFPRLTLEYPIHVVAQPDSDRLWVITQDKAFAQTAIRRFVDSDDVTESEVMLAPDGRSAYDLCFHPDFARNGYVYVGHNRARSPGGPKVSGVSRFQVNPRQPGPLDPATETTIIEWESDGHNGAAITFGLDGMLYVTSGDGTSDSDTNLRGQEMSHLTAKVLRLDVDHPVEGRQYSIPADNPFVGRSGIAPETWAYGLRNPWRITTDRKTGHVWVGNNGQDLWEQVYFVRKGDNYGWSVYEGSHPFYLSRTLGPTPHVKPALEHPHSESRSLTGGVVYYGKSLRDLAGAYIYGDHSTGKIWGARHDGARVTWQHELADTPFHITGFGIDTHGELLICDHAGGKEGGLATLVPSPAAATKTDFPRTLSATGLFQSVRGHVMPAVVVPYSVNSPLWSDGTFKVRYLALPADAPRIETSPQRAWGFPDGTVLIKSFGIDTVDGDTSSFRWIETRLMTRQQNEWIGYSYAWNDDQTDGVLVDRAGADRTFQTRTESGPQPLAWHFPSRTECMVCHSRAAGFVLGLSTPQCNRPHDYGAGRVENQLTVLERLGLASFGKGPHGRLVDPANPDEPLEARVKSYLHANCAICHVDAGGGNSLMSLDFQTPLDKMKIVDEIPRHDRLGLDDARLVAPGRPERSVLLARISRRGRGQMPQLATTRIDPLAQRLLTEWIQQLPAAAAQK